MPSSLSSFVLRLVLALFLAGGAVAACEEEETFEEAGEEMDEAVDEAQ